MQSSIGVSGAVVEEVGEGGMESGVNPGWLIAAVSGGMLLMAIWNRVSDNRRRREEDTPVFEVDSLRLDHQLAVVTISVRAPARAAIRIACVRMVRPRAAKLTRHRTEDHEWAQFAQEGGPSPRIEPPCEDQRSADGSIRVEAGSTTVFDFAFVSTKPVTSARAAFDLVWVSLDGQTRFRTNRTRLFSGPPRRQD